MMFCERLVYARKRLGLTQNELAKRSGVTWAQIAKFETGARDPSLANFRKLVVGLRVSADYLLDINIKALWEGVV